jgi:hypothetical protein
VLRRIGGRADDQLEAESKPARVFTTSMVCGKQAASTKKALDFDLEARRAMVMASAAAVASSSSEALASSRPVRSITICW